MNSLSKILVVGVRLCVDSSEVIKRVNVSHRSRDLIDINCKVIHFLLNTQKLVSFGSDLE